MNGTISANQIRAARVYLDWSQDQLAEASNLGKSTIRNLEAGFISLQSTAKVRKVFELNGLEFTEGDGVRRRADEVRFLKSANSCDDFLTDIVDTVREKRGEVLIMTRNENTLLKSCGVDGQHGQLELLNNVASVKCLFAEGVMPNPARPPFDYRVMPPHLFCRGKMYYVYGNKLALASNNGPKNDFKFILIDSPGFAEMWREEFLGLWEVSFPAMPVVAMTSQTATQIARKSGALV